MVDLDRWRSRAACRGLPPSTFYSDDPQDEATAKAICAGCDVADACEEAGRDEPGIWGGRTERERARGVRLVRRGPAPAATFDDVAAVLRAADPGRPALAQLLAVTSIGTSTAYRYLDHARQQGLVEVRAGRLYPARR
jgi:WhiB family redox-sensing transcriptional regulator